MMSRIVKLQRNVEFRTSGSILQQKANDYCTCVYDCIAYNDYWI